MSNTASKKGSSLSEFAITLLTFILVIAVVNGAFFFRNVGRKTAIKVDSIGDTVYLLYANQNEDYSVQGIDGGVFTKLDSIFAFYHKDYRVTDDGQAYCIVNSRGKTVGTVLLEKKDATSTDNRLEIDIATFPDPYVSVPYHYDSVYVYSSAPDCIMTVLSIQIEERFKPIDVIIDNVRLQAPDLSPALYCMYDADVNLEIRGNVWLEGGDNPFTTEHISGMENIAATVNVAANAYYVCMFSAIGTAASIVYGVDYYVDMFRGVTSLQLSVLDNAWGKVEDLFNGKDGADGLDGVPAVQIAAGLNIAGDSGASLVLIGGGGSDGGSGVGGLTTKTRGGDGGNGGSALVCGSLATPIQGQLTLYAGEGGQGGEPGYTPLGDHGREGYVGGQLDPKVVLDLELDPN